MKAVVTVIGHDAVGIIAKVSDVLSSRDINILEISQSVLTDMFAMILLADITRSNVDFAELARELDIAGDQLGVKIHIMHEDIFNSMHRI